MFSLRKKIKVIPSSRNNLKEKEIRSKFWNVMLKRKCLAKENSKTQKLQMIYQSKYSIIISYCNYFYIKIKRSMKMMSSDDSDLI